MEKMSSMESAKNARTVLGGFADEGLPKANPEGALTLPRSTV